MSTDRAARVIELIQQGQTASDIAAAVGFTGTQRVHRIARAAGLAVAPSPRGPRRPATSHPYLEAVGRAIHTWYVERCCTMLDFNTKVAALELRLSLVEYHRAVSGAWNPTHNQLRHLETVLGALPAWDVQRPKIKVS
jgi:hypothetical protein